MATQLDTEAAVLDLTSQQTVLTYANASANHLLCQVRVQFGDGADDLDGTGGSFEFTLQLGSHTNQPDPQLIHFSTATQAHVFTEQFTLEAGETVVCLVKSPNAADTAVYVRACLYETGVQAVVDELAVQAATLAAHTVTLAAHTASLANITALLGLSSNILATVTNTYDTSQGIHDGVDPNVLPAKSGLGVYPARRSLRLSLLTRFRGRGG